MARATTQALASTFRHLHKPGDPLLLTNVWDGISANAVSKIPGIKAMASASYAVAAARGLADNDLTLEQNLAAIRIIAPIALKANLPLTVDLQDGYDDVAATITAAIELGAVGCNIEDVNMRTGELRSKEEAVQRVKTAVQAATAAGVPDFCVNARTDILGFNGTIDDVIDRARAYLEAGACTAFVWGVGKREITGAEVQKMVAQLDGRISVKMNLGPGHLTTAELKRLGVARISIGPGLQHKIVALIGNKVEDMLKM